MLTAPIFFEDTAAMNKWYSSFEEKARSISEKYNDLDLWENRTIMLKDYKEHKVSILSMGTHIDGTDAYRAIQEILKVFNS